MSILKYDENFKNEVVEYFLNNPNLSCRKLANIFNISKDMALKWMKPYIEPKTLKKFDREYFKEINSEEKAYWLGFSYADGYISFLRNGGAYELTLCEEDKSHIEKFIKCLNAEHTLKRKEVKLKGYDKIHIAYRLNLCDYGFAKDLERRGCIERKSLTKTFPTEEQCPSEYIRHFLRGYFDGNGNISFHNNSLGIGVDSSEYFLKGFTEFCIKNIPNIGEEFNYTQVKGKNGWKCSKSGIKAMNILDYLYTDSNIYLDRKYEKYLEIKKLKGI